MTILKCPKCGEEIDLVVITDKLVDDEGFDVFFPEFIDKNGRIYYRSVCLYNGVVYPKCQNNEDSLCITRYFKRPRHLYHKWDGKNTVKCLCG